MEIANLKHNFTIGLMEICVGIIGDAHITCIFGIGNIEANIHDYHKKTHTSYISEIIDGPIRKTVINKIDGVTTPCNENTCKNIQNDYFVIIKNSGIVTVYLSKSSGTIYSWVCFFIGCLTNPRMNSTVGHISNIIVNIYADHDNIFQLHKMLLHCDISITFKIMAGNMERITLNIVNCVDYIVDMSESYATTVIIMVRQPDNINVDINVIKFPPTMTAIYITLQKIEYAKQIKHNGKVYFVYSPINTIYFADSFIERIKQLPCIAILQDGYAVISKVNGEVVLDNRTIYTNICPSLFESYKHTKVLEAYIKKNNLI